MAKLSRTMARHANAIQDVDHRLVRIERMMEALLSADQIAAIDASLAGGLEPVEANEEPVPANDGTGGEGDQEETPPQGEESPDEPAPSPKPDRRARREPE